MLDMYAEYIVRRRPDLKTSLFKMLIIAATAVLAYLALVLTTTYNLIMIMPITVAIIAWVGYRAYIMLNVEYEYIVTNGELDIDRIIARRGRKRLVNVKVSACRRIAPYNEQYKSEYENGEFVKTVDARSDQKADAWFVLADAAGGGRARILFEPTPKMLTIFNEYLPRQMAFKYVPPPEDDDIEDDED